MKRLAFLAMLLAACDGGRPGSSFKNLSMEPVSVRGWIADVEAPPSNTFHTVETEAARRAHVFRSANVWVENNAYVSGGIAETGAFLLLDVPPGNVTITFSAQGAPASHLVLQNVPGNADVLIPALLLKPDGVALLQPEAIRVRLGAKIAKARPTGRTAIIAGKSVPILEVPIGELVDRRDYPNAPGGFAPLATVR
ncbi:MAG: hypothetical protein ACXV7D_10475 [Thermoanaerobaculia bacterium]